MATQSEKVAGSIPRSAVFMSGSLNALPVVLSGFPELKKYTAGDRRCVSVSGCLSFHAALDELLTWPGCHSAFAPRRLGKGSGRPLQPLVQEETGTEDVWMQPADWPSRSLEDWKVVSLIPRWMVPKTVKMVPMAFLLGSQYPGVELEG